MSRGRPKHPQQAEIKEAFLVLLAETCSVVKAARALNCERQSLYNWRREDPEFAAAWDEARKLGIEALEDEAIRRAHEGVEEPVYQGGKLVGGIRRYSDTLLIFMLKGNKPETYKDRTSAEVSGPNGAPIAIDEGDARKRIAAILTEVKARAAKGEKVEDFDPSEFA